MHYTILQNVTKCYKMLQKLQLYKKVGTSNPPKFSCLGGIFNIQINLWR